MLYLLEGKARGSHTQALFQLCVVTYIFLMRDNLFLTFGHRQYTIQKLLGKHNTQTFTPITLTNRSSNNICIQKPLNCKVSDTNIFQLTTQ